MSVRNTLMLIMSAVWFQPRWSPAIRLRATAHNNPTGRCDVALWSQRVRAEWSPWYGQKKLNAIIRFFYVNLIWVSSLLILSDGAFSPILTLFPGIRYEIQASFVLRMLSKFYAEPRHFLTFFETFKIQFKLLVVIPGTVWHAWLTIHKVFTLS